MDRKVISLITQDVEIGIELNTALRNSGINVHIHNVRDRAELSASLSASPPPDWVIHTLEKAGGIELTEALALTRQHGLNFAVLVDPDEGTPGISAETLEHGPVVIIHRHRPGQLAEALDSPIGNESMRRSGKDGAVSEFLHERLKLLFESTTDAVAYVQEGLHIDCNPAYRALLQLDSVEALQSISLLECLESTDGEVRSVLQAMADGTFPDQILQWTIRRSDGSRIDVTVQFLPTNYDGEPCAQMRVLPKPDRVDAVTPATESTPVSPDSSLADFESFELMARRAMEQATSGVAKPALLVIRPDPDANDATALSLAETHQMARQLDRSILARLGDQDAAIRAVDLGRYVLLSDASTAEAFASEVAGALSESAVDTLEGPLLRMCFSGATTLGPMTRDLDEAAQQADEAWQSACTQNIPFARYVPDQAGGHNSDVESEWADRLRFALNNDRFHFIQQAVVNLEGASDGLYENIAVMREDAGAVAYEQFITAAESLDLGAAMDRLLIPGLLATIAGGGDRHIVTLSVNSLLDFSFGSWLLHQVEEHGVEPSQLVLQVSTETAHRHVRAGQKLFADLRREGVGLSLSQIDNQRRSLALLQQLNPGWVKLKTGLSRGLREHSANQDIVRDVVEATDSIRSVVIADGVSDAADLAVLWQCGVKLVAGEFLGTEARLTG
ncbi:MAG: EAL domain-containing protein [Xanthomonadales bacterium]|nr:EAL domain-containing protein [Xanthomonadales bacterium]